MTVNEIIEGLRQLYGEPMGLCAEYSAAFAANFPELRRVRGFVWLRDGNRRSHWWLVDKDGQVVDPTASQFETEHYGYAGISWYEPIDESREMEPTGKCHNCGEFCYDGGYFCGPQCARETEDRLNKTG